MAGRRSDGIAAVVFYARALGCRIEAGPATTGCWSHRTVPQGVSMVAQVDTGRAGSGFSSVIAPPSECTGAARTLLPSWLGGAGGEQAVWARRGPARERAVVCFT